MKPKTVIVGLLFLSYVMASMGGLLGGLVFLLMWLDSCFGTKTMVLIFLLGSPLWVFLVGGIALSLIGLGNVMLDKLERWSG